MHPTGGGGLPVKAVDAADGVDAGAGAVLAAHEGGAGGLAILGVVMAGEFEALGSEFVDVRGLVVGAAEGAGVGVAEVVGHDEDDVGLGGETEGGGEGEGQQGGQEFHARLKPDCACVSFDGMRS